MLSAEAIAVSDAAAFEFSLPPQLEAKEPAELRGTGRDDVRLLVTDENGRVRHARFAQFPDFLSPGDLIVLNDSATIPAALAGQRASGEPFWLHVSTRLPAELFIVEPRGLRVESPEDVRLPGDARAQLLTPYRDSQRLWVARFHLPTDFLAYLTQYGQPIRYRYADKQWAIGFYQNVYARAPGSAEMASAGRPLTRELLARLRDRGIGIASITLHTGVSSLEIGEAPYEEAYEVPIETADAVRLARRRGGRVIAVGTTVVRALESSLDDIGRVVASRGWANLVITPERGVRAADGLLTGFHEPRSSHLAMLEAVGGKRNIRYAYKEALTAGYLWHEFGDSHLILPAGSHAAQRAA